MNTFLLKIDIERRALRAVNERYGQPELAGVREPAISAWHGYSSTDRGQAALVLYALANALDFEGYGTGDKLALNAPGVLGEIETHLRYLESSPQCGIAG